MEQKSKFDKVMGAWDILVIAFGAMIGWGWVINSGDWITTAGFAGSIIAMLIGGLMVFFVGLTYVFIYAPQKDEIAAVMKKKGLNERKAEEEWENVEKSQHARHEYITGKKRGDRHTRDILLNSSLLGWDATAQFIEELVERRFGLTEEKLKKEA